MSVRKGKGVVQRPARRCTRGSGIKPDFDDLFYLEELPGPSSRRAVLKASKIVFPRWKMELSRNEILDDFAFLRRENVKTSKAPTRGRRRRSFRSGGASVCRKEKNITSSDWYFDTVCFVGSCKGPAEGPAEQDWDAATVAASVGGGGGGAVGLGRGEAGRGGGVSARGNNVSWIAADGADDVYGGFGTDSGPASGSGGNHASPEQRDASKKRWRSHDHGDGGNGGGGEFGAGYGCGGYVAATAPFSFVGGRAGIVDDWDRRAASVGGGQECCKKCSWMGKQRLKRTYSAPKSSSPRHRRKSRIHVVNNVQAFAPFQHL